MALQAPCPFLQTDFFATALGLNPWKIKKFYFICNLSLIHTLCVQSCLARARSLTGSLFSKKISLYLQLGYGWMVLFLFFFWGGRFYEETPRDSHVPIWGGRFYKSTFWNPHAANWVGRFHEATWLQEDLCQRKWLHDLWKLLCKTWIILLWGHLEPKF